MIFEIKIADFLSDIKSFDIFMHLNPMLMINYQLLQMIFNLIHYY